MLGADLVCFIDEMDSSPDSLGIDVPESELGKSKEEPIMQNDTRIGVDIAKAVFEVAFRTVLIG